MIVSRRIRPAFLFIAGGGALLSLAVTLLAPRGGHIDWVAAAVPLGLLIGVAASLLNVPDKTRVALSLISLALCLSSAILMILRIAHLEA